MHEPRSRRRGRLSANAGLSLALGACLCAGSLVGAGATTGAAPATAPAAPAVSVPVTGAAEGIGQGATTLDASRIDLVASTTLTAQAKRNKIIALARALKGKPYRYGAAGPRAFDCSGFTKYVYRKTIGKKLPHKAHRQQRYGVAVKKSAMKPGDLIIFRRGSYGYHAAIYAGGNSMYDSPRPGKRVGKHKIWSRNFVVRRLV